jgi:hypothetical protein
MRITFILLTAVVGLFLCGNTFAKETEKKKAEKPESKSEEILTATIEAESWLILLDEGKYSQAWEKSSAYLKSQVTKKEWDMKVKGLRDAFGKMELRKVLSREMATKLPGAPDGKYVVIRFTTTFKNKKQALETVTMMYKGGKWKCAGYYIK